MRLTTTRLRQLIREELTRNLQEQAAPLISAAAIAKIVADNNGYGPEARPEVESYVLDQFGVARILDLTDEGRKLLQEIRLVLFSAMPGSEVYPVDQEVLAAALKQIEGVSE